MTPELALRRILNLDFVTDARLWDAVPGKERIYIDTLKCNGGRTWNGGKGYKALYLDLNDKTVVARGVAGAGTRKMLAATLAALETIAAQIEN